MTYCTLQRHRPHDSILVWSHCFSCDSHGDISFNTSNNMQVLLWSGFCFIIGFIPIVWCKWSFCFSLFFMSRSAPSRANKIQHKHTLNRTGRERGGGSKEKEKKKHTKGKAKAEAKATNQVNLSRLGEVKGEMNKRTSCIT
jgi:hypothetical protein